MSICRYFVATRDGVYRYILRGEFLAPGFYTNNFALLKRTHLVSQPTDRGRIPVRQTPATY